MRLKPIAVALVSLALPVASLTACSSSDDQAATSSAPLNDPSSTNVEPTVVTAANTWVEAVAPTPDFASWVNFCCDGDVPESPVPDPTTATPPPGVYPVSLADFTADGDIVVAVSRFRSCDDDAFRNNIEFGCLDPDPEMPHDAAIDSTSPVETTIDLDDPTVTVHVIGHDCGDDGSVDFSDWSGSGTALRSLLDAFDADFATHLNGLGATYFDSSFDLSANGLPDRYAHTCTDVGITWTSAPGPSIWMPGMSPRESGYRPVADYLWGRALVVESGSTTLYLYAGYMP